MTRTVTGEVPQQEINEAEWRNPENWSGPITGIYFSKRDSRVWVPKRRPTWGRTINVAQPAGAVWLLGFLIVPWVVVAVLGGRHRKR